MWKIHNPMKFLINKIPKNAPLRKHPFQTLFCLLFITLWIAEVPGGDLFGLFGLSGIVWLLILVFLAEKDRIKQQKKKINKKKYVFLFISDFMFGFISTLILISIFFVCYFIINSGGTLNWYGLMVLFGLILFLALVCWIWTKIYEKLFSKSRRDAFLRSFLSIFWLGFLFIFVVLWVAFWNLLLVPYVFPHPYPKILNLVECILFLILFLVSALWINEKFQKKFGISWSDYP